jgi:Flp pilus assembly protein TadD
MSQSAAHALCAALVLGSTLAGCAKGGSAGGAVVEDEPAWSTREGRDQVRLDIVNTMIDAGTPESALRLIGDMRKEGQSGLDLDLAQARALRELGLFDDAAALLQAGVKRHPRDPRVRMQFGILRMDQQQVSSALVHFKAAARLDKENPEAWNNLGFALIASGRPDEAVDALRRSLQLDASPLQTRNNLGFALVAADRVDEAWRVFQAAQGPAAAHYNVGVGLEMNGAADAARARYREALAAEPGYRPARTALDRLAGGPNPAEDSPENP